MENNELIYVLSNGGHIKLTREVVIYIQKRLQIQAFAMEAGGVLLGRFIKDSKDIVVDIVTKPMPGDRQTRYTYNRISPLHQQIINQEWVSSNGTCNYLGEWHTHPEELPEPSRVDIKDWKRKLKNDTFSSRYLYFLIAGIKQIGLWEGDRRTLSIRKLINK